LKSSRVFNLEPNDDLHRSADASFIPFKTTLRVKDYYIFHLEFLVLLKPLVRVEMSSTTLNPPLRPFLDQPPSSSIPKPEDIGLNGANAWAYGVSTRLMAYPARWDLFNQVQAGLVWLDEYVQDIEERINAAGEEEEV
jgi:hypothetical protein